MKLLDRALRNLEWEREWMAERGGTLAGYLKTYGSVNDPVHSGDGGEAIYAADKHNLDRAQARVDRIRSLNTTLSSILGET
jgi:hypothetical protein